MLAEIDRRSCTADEEVAMAMTCLFHSRGPHGEDAWQFLGGLTASDRRRMLSKDHGQWLSDLPLPSSISFG